jgi:hypothetical protein
MNPNCFRLIGLTLLLAIAAMDVPWATGAGSTDALLKPPLVEDPRQAVIRRVVRSTYPELFSSSAAPGWVAITLLMNQDGTLYKGYKDDTRLRPYITGKVKAFNAMGTEYEHYGDRVQLDMRGGSAGATRIYVRAYLPKPVPDPTVDAASVRAGQPAEKRWQPEQEGPAAPNDDPSINRAIAEKYFPDLYTYTTPKNQSIADFWVLLDREGEVRATGRRYLLSQGDLKLYLESLYPGIRTDGFQATELKSNHGRPAVVNFTWLAANSPVTDLSKADLSKRGDAALYANIGGEGTIAETTLVVLRFGRPSVAVCDDKDLDLQVTASDGGEGTVILRARIQRVARPQPAEFEFGKPTAVDTAWSSESPPLRVRYGKSAEVSMTDQDHKTWKVALYPDRMRGAIRQVRVDQ